MTVKIESKIVAQEVEKENAQTEKKPQKSEKLKPRERDAVLSGRTYKRKYPDCEHSIYITINNAEERVDGKSVLRPHEIFINSKNMEHHQWTVALTRVISSVFRQGGDCQFICEELKNVFDPKSGGFFRGKRYVHSTVADIGLVIEEHFKYLEQLNNPQLKGVDEMPKQEKRESDVKGQLCPKCMSMSLVKMDGCMTCMNCGDSKCG